MSSSSPLSSSSQNNNGLFAFLIDSSRHMNDSTNSTNNATNSTATNFTSVDIAKACVESFYFAISSKCRTSPQIISPSLYLGNSDKDRSCELSSIGDHYGAFESNLKLFEAASSEDFELFSYSLYHLLNLVNKYRTTHSGADSFGLGQYAQHMQPANIFIVTDLEGLMRNRSFEMSKRSHYYSLNELRSEMWGWDQHVYLILVGSESLDHHAVDGGASSIFEDISMKENALLQVCRESGGEVYFVKDLKHASIICSAVAAKLLNNFPTATMGINLSMKKTSSSHLSHLASLPPLSLNILTHAFISEYSPRVWQIPESYWIDMYSSPDIDLKPRKPYPTLLLTRMSSTLQPTLDKWLQLCRIYDIPIDTYDLIANPFKIEKVERNKANLNNFSNSIFLSHLKACGFSKSDSFFVSMEGSNNPNSVSINSSSTGGSNSNFTPSDIVPFGICKYNHAPDGSNGNFHILILPFNFPKFLNLIKNIHEGLDTVATAYIKNQVQQDFKSYISTVPHYYYHTFLRIIENNKVLNSAIGSQMKVLPMMQVSNKNLNKFKKAQEVATLDVHQINEITRVKRSVGQCTFGVPDVMGLAIKYETDYANATKLPSSMTGLKSEDLLLQWESFRRAVYGGGNGSVVSGLHVRGVESTSRQCVTRADLDVYREVASSSNHSIHNNDYNSKNGGSIIDNSRSSIGSLKRKCAGNGSGSGSSHGGSLGVGLDWSAVGGAAFVRGSMKDMSDFVPVLSRKQVTRDPLLLDPALDENEPMGILKRKLDVDLNPAGNKYGKKRRGLDSKTSSITAATATSSSASSSQSSSILTFTDTLVGFSNENLSLSGVNVSFGIGGSSDRHDKSNSSSSSSFSSSSKPPAVHLLPPSSSSPSSHLSEAGAAAFVSSFFADTPNPYLLSYDSDNFSISSNNSNNLLFDSSDNSSTNYISAADSDDDHLIAHPKRQATKEMKEMVVGTVNQESSKSQQQFSLNAITTTVSSSPSLSSQSVVHVTSSGDELPLPSGWTQQFSNKHNRVYWFHQKENKSTWIRPA